MNRKISKFCEQKCCKNLKVEIKDSYAGATLFSFYCDSNSCSYKPSGLLKRLYFKLISIIAR